MSFDDWDKNIDEFVEETEQHAQRPLTEADAKLEEERVQKAKMKEPMTAEQDKTHIGLSVEEENERALKLGLLHSRIDSFQADQPPPPHFDQTTEAGGSSSAPEAGGSSTIPESTTAEHSTVTGTGAAMIVYETPNVSPTDVEMHTASEQGEEEEADHMDI